MKLESSISFPVETNRNLLITMRYEFLPNSYENQFVVVYFKGKSEDSQITHPVSFNIKVFQSSFELSLSSMNVQIDPNKQNSHILWMKNKESDTIRVLEAHADLRLTQTIFSYHIKVNIRA